MNKPLLLISMAACLFLAVSCNPLSTNQDSLVIDDAWVRAVSLVDEVDSTGVGIGTNSAAYLTIVNSTSTADDLLQVECDAAQAVEIHETKMENDVMSMHPVEQIEIPSGASLEFKPGGLHIMLIGLKQELVAGENLLLTLVFKTAGRITVNAEIRNN